MKKIMVIFLCVACILVLFCGCAEVWQDIDKEIEAESEKRAEKQAAIDAMTDEYLQTVAIDANLGFIYYRDVRTDVMYSVYEDTTQSANGRGCGCGLTVMYHPDGTPLLYSEWSGFEATPDHAVVVPGGGDV